MNDDGSGGGITPLVDEGSVAGVGDIDGDNGGVGVALAVDVARQKISAVLGVDMWLGSREEFDFCTQVRADGADLCHARVALVRC